MLRTIYRYIIKTDKLLLDNNYKIILHEIVKKAWRKLLMNL